MNDPIRLGLMAPLTGLVSLYGPEIERAARLAVAMINESGGVLGRPLELVVADDGSMPEPALAAARALVDQGCAALIGNLLSNARIAVADQVATPGEIPLLNFSFYEGSISSPWFFNFAALPNQQIDRMIPTMVDMGGPKMYFAGNNYEWPRGSIDAAKRALVAAGGEVLDEVYLPIGADPADIADLVADVGRSGADVFVPYFAGQDQINLLNAFGEAGLKSRMDVVMGHYDEAMVAALGPEVREGLFSVNTYFMAIDNPVNRRTLARLAAETGGLWPEGPGVMTNFGEGAHVCVLAFAAAAAAAGRVESAALAEALTHVRVDAPQGLVIMDPATRHAAVNAWLARCHADGSFSIVTEFGRITPEIPERYRTVPGADPVAAEPLCPLPRPAPDLDLDGLFGPIIDLPDLAVVATDATGRILRTNAGAAEMFGYHQAEMVGMSVHLLVPPHLRNRHGQAMARFAQGAATHIRMGSRGEISGYRKDGTMFPAQASLSRFTIAKAPVLVATLRDISERKQAEADLMWRATHDPLTGLPNRTLLRERLNNALERSARSGQDVILMFIDLDNFKLVNDTLGHESGDKLLVRVAETLLAVVRPGDIVARLGGDEFVVLCTEVDSTSRITHLAERINDALRLPMTCDGREVVTTASIGIARGVGGVDRGDDLLRNADAAMYLSKERGRDSWHEFSDDLHETAQRKLQILSGLRTAIERDQFDLVYQPILACGSQRILGAEALLRWTGPDGPVSPGVFIPVAEQAGLIAPIGRWVFDAACATLAGWLDRFGPDGPYVSVNLSVDQLNVPGLIDDFAGILDHYLVPPSRILLEVTETSLMTDIDRNLATLRALNDLGLVLAVDDFGTGYSSLLQLLRLPVDTLKIDREFVDGVDKREDSRQVVAAIVRMARSLRKRVIAEGVETEAQAAHLRDLGCDGVQGFLFHRPMSAGAFADLLDRQSPSDGDGRGEIHMAIYASRAIAPLTHDDLHHLLEVARQQNRRNGITGLLIYRDGRFLQYLEGPEEKLDDLLAVIAADRRHTDMRIVDRQPLASRLFGDWSMGAWQPHFGGASLDLDQLANNVPMCRTVFEALAQRR